LDAIAGPVYEAMPTDGKIGIGAKKADNCVLIEVEDTGLETPSEIREGLFKPFVAAGKDQGLRLGFAIFRQTVLHRDCGMWTELATGAVSLSRSLTHRA
jgi:signal transduction histidine kinase